MKHRLTYILILLAAVASSCLLTRKCSRPAEVVHEVHITDTVTDVEFDTVFFEKTDTGWLHTTDSVYVWKDSLLVLVDSVQVEVPISRHTSDRHFDHDSASLDLHLSMTGYHVTIDTLAYNISYKYKTYEPVRRHRVAFTAGCFVGAGVDPRNGRVVPAIGVGVGIGITAKKW